MSEHTVPASRLLTFPEVDAAICQGREPISEPTTASDPVYQDEYKPLLEAQDAKTWREASKRLETANGLLRQLLAAHLGDGEKCQLELIPGEACYSCSPCQIEIPPSGRAGFKCVFEEAAAHLSNAPTEVAGK